MADQERVRGRGAFSHCCRRSMMSSFNCHLLAIIVVVTVRQSRGDVITFLNAPFVGRIYTSAPVGIDVMTCSACDMSASAGGSCNANVTISYFLTGADSATFSIDSVTGDITNTQTITRSLGSVYQLIATATGAGLSTYQPVSIIVSDYNVYTPSFVGLPLVVPVYPVTNPGAYLTTLVTYDPDVDFYNRICVFYFSPGTNPFQSLFQLNYTTGVLNLASSLQASSSLASLAGGMGTGGGGVNVSIVAQNTGSPHRQTSAVLSIIFSDVSAPTKFNLLNVSLTYVTLCWSAPQYGIASSYVLFYYDLNGTSLINQYLTVNSSAGMTSSNDSVQCSRISPLVPYHTYVASALGVDQYGSRGPSTPLILFTANSTVCLNNPCNGGTCTVADGTAAGYQCFQCPPGLLGPTCSIPDPCSLGGGHSPCLNGGTCQDVTTGNGILSYQCACAAGYWGSTCSSYNPCTTSTQGSPVSPPCLNGATCSNISTSSYLCQCPPAFTGNTCQVSNPCRLNPCNGSPCQNSGNSGFYTCSCSPGYYGTNCASYNPCWSSPCANMATCTAVGLNYTCTCPAGYQGSTCSWSNPCLLGQCSNGGTCINVVSGQYTCSCVTGYYGTQCTARNVCSLSEPCVNGDCVSTGDGQYSCNCRVGWYGTDCSQYNPCVTNPCQNQATCRNPASLQYTCQCTTGYYGSACQFYNACTLQPCFNGATCVNSTGSANFSCVCVFGYYGLYCQYYNACTAEPSPCQNGASCLVLTSQTASGSQYICQCPSGYYGRNCDLINACMSSPCINSITCANTSSSGAYTCTCLPGYYGPQCGSYNPCGIAVCHNGGYCTSTGNTTNAYQCTCVSGYYGQNCDYFNPCYSTPCANGASCINASAVSYSCACASGYYGTTCTLYNPCLGLGNPVCLNQGTCKNISDMLFTCTCQSGYYGSTCAMFDPCSLGTICQHGSVCVNISSGAYQCVCNTGYYGSDCQLYNGCLGQLNPVCSNSGICHNTTTLGDYICACASGYYGSSCQNYNPCSQAPCLNGATCRNVTNTAYNCSCPVPLFGSNCQNYDFCSTHVPGGGLCQNGAVCSLSNVQPYLDVTQLRLVSVPLSDGTSSSVQIVDYGQCSCAAGYTGADCGVEIIECASSPCQNGASCVDSIAAFTCICVPGYTGVTCDAQTMLCASGPCANGATCTNLINAFRCTCIPGFTGAQCQIEIDECASQPCSTNGACINLLNAFQCNCTPGYDGVLCNHEINECSSNPCITGQGTCINAVNSFSCSCVPGFTGNLCQTQISECVSKPCVNGGICMDVVNAFSCICMPGYTGTTCQVEINECASGPCANGGTCTEEVNAYSCACPAGVTGKSCQTVINECASAPCLNGGSCTGILNGYFCTCPSGVAGVNCQINVNACVSSPCVNAVSCINLVDGFNCVCNAGFTGVRCDVDIDECASSPCQNGATCKNIVVAQYGCACAPGYTGTDCSTVIDECTSGPCLNNSTCVSRIGSFICTCVPGYTGTQCESTINECLSVPCMYGGTCTPFVNGFTCVCLPGYSGPSCALVGSCAPDVTTGMYGNVSWPSTPHSSLASAPCPYGTVQNSPANAAAYRFCNLTGLASIWTTPDFSQCLTVDYLLAAELLQEYIQMTAYPPAVSDQLISAATIALKNTIKYADLDNKIGDLWLNLVSNLLGVSDVAMASSNTENRTATTLLTLVYNFTRDTVVPNSVLNTAISYTDLYVLIPAQQSNNTSSNIVANYHFSAQQQNGQVLVSGQLPYTTLQIIGSQRAAIVVYYNDLFFIPNPLTSSSTTPVTSYLVAGAVLSVAATNIAYTSQLVNPVVFVMVKPMAGFPSVCACWNFQIQDWSLSGISLTQSNYTHSTCQIWSLGFCAVLAEVPIVPQTVTLISYIGCGVFMLCILMTLICYAVSLSARPEKFGKVAINICLSMLLLNIFFVVATRWSLCNTAGCIALMLIFHYFLVSSFLWLTIDVFDIYQMIVKVFISYENFYTLKRALCAWGLPAIFVAITISIDVTSYEDPSLYCRTPVQNGAVFYTCFLGYVCLFTLVSLVLFIMICFEVSRSTGPTSSSDVRVTVNQIFLILSTVVLFGVSWIIGLFAMKDGGVALEVVFCILNSLCGITIFAGRCPLSEDMKSAWVEAGAGRWGRSGTTKFTTTPGVISRWSDTKIMSPNPVIKTTNNAWDPSPAMDQHTEFRHYAKSSPTSRRNAERYRSSSMKYGRPNVSYVNSFDRRNDSLTGEDNMNIFDSTVKLPYDDKLTYI